MKERPILFSGQMVRAILDGRKTQTRRIMNPQPFAAAQLCGRPMVCWSKNDPSFHETKCKYGNPGERLWVRETWQCAVVHDEYKGIGYKASYDNYQWFRPTDEYDRWYPLWYTYQDKWRPSIHMPRWASRITLEVTGIKVERLQRISEEDAISEGVLPTPKVGYSPEHISARAEFMKLWESIYGAGSWDANPLLWVLQFKQVKEEKK